MSRSVLLLCVKSIVVYHLVFVSVHQEKDIEHMTAGSGPSLFSEYESMYHLINDWVVHNLVCVQGSLCWWPSYIVSEIGVKPLSL